MVETGGLENRCTRKGIGGSNPSPSATMRLAYSRCAGTFVLPTKPFPYLRWILFSPTTGDGASWPQSVSSGLYLQRIRLDAPGLTFVTFLWVVNQL